MHSKFNGGKEIGGLNGEKHEKIHRMKRRGRTVVDRRLKLTINSDVNHVCTGSCTSQHTGSSDAGRIMGMYVNRQIRVRLSNGTDEPRQPKRNQNRNKRSTLQEALTI